MAKLKVDDLAPDFQLLDDDGKQIQLSSYRAKNPVVLIFYPGDETPLCTAQLCAARDSSAQYQEAGAIVFGINGGNQNSHEKFSNKHNFTFPLLVDKGLEVAGRYDAVLGFGILKLVNRTVVVVNDEGKIIFFKRGVPSTEEILAPLKKGVKS